MKSLISTIWSSAVSAALAVAIGQPAAAQHLVGGSMMTLYVPDFFGKVNIHNYVTQGVRGGSFITGVRPGPPSYSYSSLDVTPWRCNPNSVVTSGGRLYVICTQYGSTRMKS